MAAGAAHRLSETMHGIPITPAPRPKLEVPEAPSAPGWRPSGSTPALASFLVRSGSLRGTRLPVRVPVVNIGRAEYNDIVIPDESVSTLHAKLQRREEIWVLTDNGSTNGTFVDGERISGEAILSPGALIRFGETAVMFEPTDVANEVKKGSGTKVMGAVQVPGAPPPIPMADRPAPPPEPLVPAPKPAIRRPVVVATPRPKGLPGWVVPVAVVIILAVIAAVLLSKK
jgi:FHA domain-containing protein